MLSRLKPGAVIVFPEIGEKGESSRRESGKMVSSDCALTHRRRNEKFIPSSPIRLRLGGLFGGADAGPAFLGGLGDAVSSVSGKPSLLSPAGGSAGASLRLDAAQHRNGILNPLHFSL